MKYRASALITAAAQRAGRDEEQRVLRQMCAEDERRRGHRTRDAAAMAGRSGVRSAGSYGYPPAGSAAWEGRTLADDPEEEPFFGRPLPRPGEPIPREPPVQASIPYQYGQGNAFARIANNVDRITRAAADRLERENVRDEPPPPFAARVERDYRAAQGDESGFIQPAAPGDPRDPDRQSVGYAERGEEYSTLDEEEIGLLPHHVGGEPEDYFMAHDPMTGDIAVFRHGRDGPVGFIRRGPGMAAQDCRLVRDRRSGCLMVLRRRHRDRLRALTHEQDRLGRGRARDGLQQERQLLAMQSQVNAEFWRRPRSASDFWGRR
jgi:hypothetical protein